MIRSPVKKVTVEYENGDVATYSADDMRHTIRRNFPGGANPKEVDAFKTHEIIWTER